MITKKMLKAKQFAAGLLLLLLSASYVSSTMFYHNHIIQGQRIYHSHFYLGGHTTSSDDGGHTLDAVELIARLGDISYESQRLFTSVEAPLFSYLSLLDFTLEQAPQRLDKTPSALRGPPSNIAA